MCLAELVGQTVEQNWLQQCTERQEDAHDLLEQQQAYVVLIGADFSYWVWAQLSIYNILTHLYNERDTCLMGSLW